MIENIQADIFDYGPQRCDAMIVWGRHGLNAFSATYQSFNERLRHGSHEVEDAKGRAVELGVTPWTTAAAGTPLVITPPLGRLRVLYSFPIRRTRTASTMISSERASRGHLPTSLGRASPRWR